VNERHSELYVVRNGTIAYRKGFSDADEAPRLLRFAEAVSQTPPGGLSLWQVTTTRSRRRSNQAGRAVNHRETALQDLGPETLNARLWVPPEAVLYATAFMLLA